VIEKLVQKLLRFFRKEKEQEAITEAPEFKYLGERRRTEVVTRYRMRHLSKPGSKASRQDLSKFFKGKGKFAPWYRKQIKKKVKVEENEL